ncbi:MAG: sigma-70 family RNA polymerase sigma factor [Chloroflexota bacterium]
MDDYITLVIDAQSNNEHDKQIAFDTLVPRFQRMAFSVAYNTLQDVHLAEDAVQEAFLTAYLRIDQLRDPEAFPAWLKRIVLTQCDRLIRGKRPQLESIEARYDIATEKPSPEDVVEEHELQAQIMQAIAALPEHERAVTERFYMQGESQKEIAAGLDVPVTTVKKRLQYAREHLRLMIGDINAVMDEAIARVLKPQPAPEPQPAYVYARRRKQSDDDTY